MTTDPLLDHEALDAFYRFLAQWLAAVPPDTRKLILDDMRKGIDHLEAHAADDQERRRWLRARQAYFGLRSTSAAADDQELP